mmetsp:Transcript_113918/g.305464  ORF Transcript_113918/g.305464 Transcript_113918/m.305464 type:complete len:223 (-) Transcript_113918:58-726(-)
MLIRWAEKNSHVTNSVGRKLHAPKAWTVSHGWQRQKRYMITSRSRMVIGKVMPLASRWAAWKLLRAASKLFLDGCTSTGQLPSTGASQRHQSSSICSVDTKTSLWAATAETQAAESTTCSDRNVSHCSIALSSLERFVRSVTLCSPLQAWMKYTFVQDTTSSALRSMLGVPGSPLPASRLSTRSVPVRRWTDSCWTWSSPREKRWKALFREKPVKKPRKEVR